MPPMRDALAFDTMRAPSSNITSSNTARMLPVLLQVMLPITTFTFFNATPVAADHVMILPAFLRQMVRR